MDHLRLFSPYEIYSYAPLDDGHLVHETAAPLFSKAECAAVVAESEEVAAARNGWTSTRHQSASPTRLALLSPRSY